MLRNYFMKMSPLRLALVVFASLATTVVCSLFFATTARLLPTPLSSRPFPGGSGRRCFLW